MDMGKEDVGIDEIESVMRDIAWTDSGDMGSVDKYEMFAVASKVMKRMEALGK